MKYIRKKLSVLLIIVTILMMTCNARTYAAPAILYQKATVTPITSGASLTSLTRLTTEGWQNINILLVDLFDPNIKVDTLTAGDSALDLATTQDMAQASGAVAAINAGFFNWIQGGNGYADGPVVQSGDLISANSEYNRYGDYMATFALSKDNEAIFEYWKTDIFLIAPNGNQVQVVNFNKPSTYYYDFTVLDRRWGTYSVGASEVYPDIYEMVVIDGIVAEIRCNLPSIEIPENGYVVVTRTTGSEFLLNNFKVGDPVNLQITTNPDWNQIQMAVTGSSILIKNGIIPSSFSMDDKTRNPRTAVGSTIDGKKLMLVTVDGRQNKSLGMTQRELAEFMLSLGAYNAINLDGGGSTTMVARDVSTREIKVVNSLPAGVLRAVSTAIGVFSIAPPSALDRLIIETEDPNVFVNTSREFFVKGYDRYLNEVSINEEEIKWEVFGVEGRFEGNKFYPTTTGKAEITATIGDISASFDIWVLDLPVQLFIDNKAVNVTVNKPFEFNVKGKSPDGYYAKIDPADVNWTVSNDIGSFNQGLFTAVCRGKAYVEASLGEARSYCAVYASSSDVVYVQDFEEPNGIFTSYPAYVTGSYEISNEQKHSGEYSGKLSYNFIPTEDTQAAYLLFSDNGITLDSSTDKLGLWVYNDHPNSSWLRAEVFDASGQKHLIDFTRNLDWNGWQYVEASLESVNEPARLTRIYLAQVYPTTDSGAVYFDDLSYSVSYHEESTIELPEDVIVPDKAIKAADMDENPGAFNFAVFGQSRGPKNLLEKILLNTLVGELNQDYNISAFIGTNVEESDMQLKTLSLSTIGGYGSYDILENRFIKLDISGGGLRKSDPAQWPWFLDKLSGTKFNNLFIFLSGPIDSFEDPLEAELLKDLLTQLNKDTGKNIWVFYKGDKNESYTENGVRYLSTAGFDIEGLTPDTPDVVSYIHVTIDGSQITYEFKPIIQ